MTRNPTPLEAHDIYGPTVADVLVYLLNLADIDRVFGVPGGAIEPLVNALARSERRGGARLVVTRHEEQAGFAADAYYRETGRPAAVTATAGPGTTNLLTGVASAYVDGVPMLVLSAQSALSRFGQGALQDSSDCGVDTVSIFRHCTALSTLVSDPGQLQHKMSVALLHMRGSRPGPVHLALPVDLGRASRYGMDIRRPACPQRLSEASQLPLLARWLEEASQPRIMLGRGIGGAVGEAMRLVERLGVPFVVTSDAKGMIDHDHPLFMGVYGLAGHRSARSELDRGDIDLILAIGVALTEVNSCGWRDNSVYSATVIHIDDDERRLYTTPHARCHVLCVLGPLLDALTAALPPSTRAEAGTLRLDDPDRAIKGSASGALVPQYLFHQLSRRVHPDTRVTADSGNSFLWGIHYWHVAREATRRENRFHVGMGLASMGWSIGAAIGIALANPDVPVLAFVGDGSLLMNGQEITVALQENLNVLMVILNDAAHGMVKHGQRLADSEPYGFRLPRIRYDQVFEAMGIPSVRIETQAAFDALDIAAIQRRGGPFVIDAVIDGEQVPPLGMRMRALGTGGLEPVRVPTGGLGAIPPTRERGDRSARRSWGPLQQGPLEAVDRASRDEEPNS